MGATLDETIPAHDLEPVACRILETLLVAAVLIVAVLLGAMWLPPHSAPADCTPTVGAPESPVPSWSALCDDSGADTNGGRG